MENTQHDIHQYYFERYLRNKLTADEKLHIEQRLHEDPELQIAFESYKKNRKIFLKELISEHDKGPRKSRLANLFYLAVTIAGIIVALNFYLENKSLREERKRDKNLITRLIEYIPFVGKKEQDKSEPIKDNRQKQRTVVNDETGNEAEEDSVTNVVTEEATVSIHDTVLVPVKRSYVEERVAFYRNEVDSSLTEAEILALIYRNNHKYDIRHKAKPIGIEFRNATSGGNAYRFDGNHLVVYGMSPPYEIFLVQDQNEILWMRPGGEIILIADNEAHLY